MSSSATAACMEELAFLAKMAIPLVTIELDACSLLLRVSRACSSVSGQVIRFTGEKKKGNREGGRGR